MVRRMSYENQSNMFMSAYMAMARTCSLTEHHGAGRSIILRPKLILQRSYHWMIMVNVNEVTFNDLQSAYGSESSRS